MMMPDFCDNLVKSPFRYNVGDKVIDLSSLSLWDNTMHFSKFEDHFIHTVTSATEKFFSVTRFDVTLPMNYEPFNNQYIYNQEDGSCREYTPLINNKLYHMVHDNQRVVDFLKKKFEEATLQAEQTDLSEIAKLEAEIARIQRRIDHIKAGKREAINRKFSQKEFLAARIKTILGKLSLNS